MRMELDWPSSVHRTAQGSTILLEDGKEKSMG